jgi:hypothetical protein
MSMPMRGTRTCATFLALISKKNNPGSFDEFKSISISNCIYKMLEKILAGRL